MTPSLSFLFNDTATTEIYTLSLHDALPILAVFRFDANGNLDPTFGTDGKVNTIISGRDERPNAITLQSEDRKSTRLNSSHVRISYAVFCLKKKTNDYPGIYGVWHTLVPFCI